MTRTLDRFAPLHPVATSDRLLVMVTDPVALPAARRITAALVLDAARRVDLDRPGAHVYRLLRAGGAPAGVSPQLARLIAVALDAAADHDGLLDPTTGTAAVLHASRLPPGLRIAGGGLLPTCARLDAGRPRPAAGQLPGSGAVRLLGRRVQLPAGTVLDLRATTDAAVAELAARAVAQRLGVGAVVGIGGDVAQAGPAPAGGWPLVLPDGAIVRLPAGRAAATMRADRPGLILDPHTCAAVPAAWACLTVVDRDPLRAKATALAAAVLGPDGDAYLRLRGARYRLVGLDGAERRSAGWPTAVRSVPAPRSGSLAS